MANRKNDTKYHEILKQAAIYVYHGKNAQLPADYHVIDSSKNKENGFYAEAYSNGKDVIIAYRGTDTDIKNIFPDFANDCDMVRSKLPSQCIDAVRFHDKVAREHPNCDITVTGHSLGGSNAAITSAIRGTTAVTFNAYGVRDMFTPYARLKEDNIVNYVNEWDSMTMSNAENLIGDTYAVQGKFGHFAHFIEDFEPLSNREFRTTEDLKRHKNVFNRVKNKGIYSSHVIKTGIKKVINRTSKCVGSYYVSGYTREDGTKIGGYIRTCGAKHNN